MSVICVVSPSPDELPACPVCALRWEPARSSLAAVQRARPLRTTYWHRETAFLAPGAHPRGCWKLEALFRSPWGPSLTLSSPGLLAGSYGSQSRRGALPAPPLCRTQRTHWRDSPRPRPPTHSWPACAGVRLPTGRSSVRPACWAGTTLVSATECLPVFDLALVSPPSFALTCSEPWGAPTCVCVSHSYALLWGSGAGTLPESVITTVFFSSPR